jgi:hypothetical protein
MHQLLEEESPGKSSIPKKSAGCRKKKQNRQAPVEGTNEEGVTLKADRKQKRSIGLAARQKEPSSALSLSLGEERISAEV